MTNPKMDKIRLSPLAKSIKPGIYQHYKGKKYQVFGVAIHSETLEEFVIYQALYGKKLIWIRPTRMFSAKVVIRNKTQLRFKFIK